QPHLFDVVVFSYKWISRAQGDWIPPVPAFLFWQNHLHGGKALPRGPLERCIGGRGGWRWKPNSTNRGGYGPAAYAVRLRGRVPADAALTKMYGKMTDFFGEKDGKNRKSF